MAAHRVGLKEAILPLDNQPDIKDLPKKIKEDVVIHLVESMDEVLRIALKGEFPSAPKKQKGEMLLVPISSSLSCGALIV